LSRITGKGVAQGLAHPTDGAFHFAGIRLISAAAALEKRILFPLMANMKLLLPTRRDIPASTFRRFADSVLNLFYPDACLVCAHPISRAQDCGVCVRCWEKALQQRIVGPSCPSCGLPYRTFASELVHLCGRCMISPPRFSGARAFGWYGAELSGMIRALKFGGRRDLVELLAPLLASTLLECWDVTEIDLVVPVPLHPERQRERGYNQAALLGASLARLIGRPFKERTLSRVRNTQPQVGLSDSERSSNLRHAFRCALPAVAHGARVLLVDDVMTTGSTAESASEALLEGGALRVSVLTVARAVVGVE